MKQDIIGAIFLAEKQKVAFNTKEYYFPFETLYEADKVLFMRSVLELRDNLKILSEIDLPKYFCNEVVCVHLCRISVYFDIEIQNLSKQLKSLFYQSAEMSQNNNYEIAAKGHRLFFSALAFLKSLVVDSTSDDKQKFYQETSVNMPSFENFISLNEVTNISMAVLYEECAKLGIAEKTPSYIKYALKAALIHDGLFGTVPCQYYLQTTSSSRMRKDIAALRKVGFIKIPDLLEQFVIMIDTYSPVSKEKKLRFCEKICAKHREQIENAMDEEENTINQYINSNRPIL